MKTKKTYEKTIKDGQRIIYIESDRRDMDLDFVIRKVRKIYKNEPTDTQLVLPDGFVIDGLNQTNVGLIVRGSVLENTYTGNNKRFINKGYITRNTTHKEEKQK